MFWVKNRGETASDSLPNRVYTCGISRKLKHNVDE
jgi:hypothetical protein